MTTKQAFVTSILFLYALLLVITTAEKFFVRDGRMVDDSNRERFFHGLNVVYKSPPYHPIVDHFDADLSFSTEDMELFQELGMNSVRLGVMWPGVEPERGEYNTTYIELMKDLIEQSYEYGIYTLVDAHQDVFSEKYCGEGVPLWAAESSGMLQFPLPLQTTPYEVDNETGIPLPGLCSGHPWASYYFTQATSTAFQHLYDNTDGLRTAFAESWGQLASTYKDIDGVIGFELLNEPWAGDIFSEPKLMYPGVADRENLVPFYEELSAAIHEVDDDRLVFFESVTWSDLFGKSYFDMGFDQVPGGSEYANRSIFSYHYYTPPNIGDKNKYFDARVNDATKLGCAGFLTEFNVPTSVSEGFIDTMDLMDSHLQSWMGWEYKPYAGSLPDGTCTGCGYGLFSADGSQNEELSQYIARTYAKAVAGQTKFMQFNSTTADFTLIFTIDTSISSPTEIYLSEKYWYSNGYEVSITPSDALDWTKSSQNHIQFSSSSSVASGTTITIFISQTS